LLSSSAIVVVIAVVRCIYDSEYTSTPLNKERKKELPLLSKEGRRGERGALDR